MLGKLKERTATCKDENQLLMMFNRHLSGVKIVTNMCKLLPRRMVVSAEIGGRNEY